jgi:hypothetical protein
MITDFIVYCAGALTLAFVVAWILRPDLRAWIERPKYQFLENVRRYDRGAGVDEPGRKANE